MKRDAQACLNYKNETKNDGDIERLKKMTATNMNIFEYFHYMTSFIDELVEKHGYDRAVIVNTWRSENEKWMIMEVEDEKPVVIKKKTTIEKCIVNLKTGKNKGNACGKNVVPGTHTCKSHTFKD